jgi:hypothetical protein
LGAALIVFATVGAAWAAPGYYVTPLATFPTSIYGTLPNSYGETLLPNGTVIGMADYQAPAPPGSAPPWPQTELVTWNSNGSVASTVDYGMYGNVYDAPGDGAGHVAINGETSFGIYSGGTLTTVPQLAGGGVVLGGMSPSGLVGGFNGNGGFVVDAVTGKFYAVGDSNGAVLNVGSGCAVGTEYNGTSMVGLIWTESTQAISYVPSMGCFDGISSNNNLMAGVSSDYATAAVYNASKQTTTTYWSGEATGVNASGLVIGDNAVNVCNNVNGIYTSRAMANINGQTLDLTNAYAPAGVTYNMAVAVNDAGQILVWSQGDQQSDMVATSYLLTPALPGDANLDHKVDINDLTIVLSNYNRSTGMSWSTGDFVGDGTVDINDLTIVLADYGASFGASGAGNLSATPEPGTLALIAAGAVALLPLLRRRPR